MILISDFAFSFAFSSLIQKNPTFSVLIFGRSVLFKYSRFSFKLDSYSTQLDFDVAFWVNSSKYPLLTHLPYLNTLDDDYDDDDDDEDDDDDDNSNKPISEPSD